MADWKPSDANGFRRSGARSTADDPPTIDALNVAQIRAGVLAHHLLDYNLVASLLQHLADGRCFPRLRHVHAAARERPQPHVATEMHQHAAVRLIENER